MASLAVSFDYAALDRADAEYLLEKTGEIRELARTATDSILRIGAALIDVKQRVGHGNFLPWLESEFHWTERHARRFMCVADAFKSDNLSGLEIDSSALYLLAAPSTPPEVRAEVITRAQQGERISHATAQQAVREFPAKVERAIAERVAQYHAPAPTPEPQREPIQVAPEVLEAVPDVAGDDLDIICELERVMKDLSKSGYTPEQIAYFASEMSVPAQLFKQTGQFLLEVANAS